MASRVEGAGRAKNERPVRRERRARRASYGPGVALGLALATLATSGCNTPGSRRSANKSEEPSRVQAAAGESSSQTGQASESDASTPKIRKYSAAERGALRERALELLTNLATTGTPEERANAIEALGPTPARLSAVAEPALRDPNPAVRTVALVAGGKAKLPGFAGRVRPLMNDDSPFVRAAALFALKRLGERIDLSPLGTLLEDPSPRVRAHAAFLLGELGETSALGPLRDAARAPLARAGAGEVRVMELQIAEARVKLGDEAGLADLRSALFPARVEDLEGAVLAMQVLGQVKDKSSINRLIQLTAVKDETGAPLPGELRMSAAAALARLGQPSGSYIGREYFISGSDTLRAQAAFLFGETGRPENLQLLERMLTDPVGRVRIAAASSIVKVTEAEARRD